MEITYRKNLGKSYMCIEEEGNLIEPYELRMLEHRNIPCLLSMQTIISEGKNRYLYDISGKQQIADYFSGKKMGHDFLQTFLFSVHEVCVRLPEYLLREEGICLQEEFIYVNLEDESLQFTYLPFYDRNLPEAFQACMEQILRKIDHQDSAAVALGYQAYQLCIKENVNIEKLLENVLGKPMLHEEKEMGMEYGVDAADAAYNGCVQENKSEEKGDRKVLEKGSKGIRTGKIDILWNSLKNSLKETETVQKYLSGFCKIFTKTARERKQNHKERFQEKVEHTPVQEEADAPVHPTEFLGVRENTPMGKLVYHGIHQCGDIQVEGDVFLLGKNAAQVEGVISAEGVSRLHARITRQEDNYFIEDLNSTNGTYLNDMMLEYHQPKLLKPRDKVRFGVEEYMFL